MSTYVVIGYLAVNCPKPTPSPILARFQSGSNPQTPVNFYPARRLHSFTAVPTLNVGTTNFDLSIIRIAIAVFL